MTGNNRKLLSCFTNFSHLKLIITLLMLFISIKCDDGDNVHRFKGHGVPSNVSVDQVSTGQFPVNTNTVNVTTENATTESHYNFIVNSSHTVNDAERVLSRQRRYLIFPEGSSIQLGMKYV